MPKKKSAAAATRPYVGWLSRLQNGPGFNDTWLLRLTADAHGKPIVPDKQWRGHTAGEVVDLAERDLGAELSFLDTPAGVRLSVRAPRKGGRK